LFSCKYKIPKLQDKLSLAFFQYLIAIKALRIKETQRVNILGIEIFDDEMKLYVLLDRLLPHSARLVAREGHRTGEAVSLFSLLLKKCSVLHPNRDPDFI
jgi:hypothetical protein